MTEIPEVSKFSRVQEQYESMQNERAFLKAWLAFLNQEHDRAFLQVHVLVGSDDPAFQVGCFLWVKLSNPKAFVPAVVVSRISSLIGFDIELYCPDVACIFGTDRVAGGLYNTKMNKVMPRKFPPYYSSKPVLPCPYALIAEGDKK